MSDELGHVRLGHAQVVMVYVAVARAARENRAVPAQGAYSVLVRRQRANLASSLPNTQSIKKKEEREKRDKDEANTTCASYTSSEPDEVPIASRGPRSAQETDATVSPVLMMRQEQSSTRCLPLLTFVKRHEIAHLGCLRVPHVNRSSQPDGENVLRAPVNQIQIKVVLDRGRLQHLAFRLERKLNQETAKTLYGARAIFLGVFMGDTSRALDCSLSGDSE